MIESESIELNQLSNSYFDNVYSEDFSSSNDFYEITGSSL